MAEKGQGENFAYSNSDEIPADATEACTSRNGTTSRGLGRSAATLEGVEVERSEEQEQLQRNMDAMMEKMSVSFPWVAPFVGELEERILGSVEPPSETLEAGLQQLFLASKLSFLNENSSELMKLFAHEALTVEEIREYLQQEKYPKRKIDELHVPKRLVTVFTQLATTYDG